MSTNLAHTEKKVKEWPVLHTEGLIQFNLICAVPFIIAAYCLMRLYNRQHTRATGERKDSLMLVKVLLI